MKYVNTGEHGYDEDREFGGVSVCIFKCTRTYTRTHIHTQIGKPLAIGEILHICLKTI